jgi:hypothetical protein
MSLATFNVQAFSSRKPIDVVLKTLSVQIVGFQSTGVRARSFAPQPDFALEKRAKYNILHFPTVSALPGGCALAFLAKKYPCSAISKISTPPGPLWGRGGACRLRKRGAFDITSVVAYMPLAGTQDGCQQYDLLVNWMQDVLDATPARSLPMIFLDANAHLSGPVFSTTGKQSTHTPYIPIVLVCAKLEKVGA